MPVLPPPLADAHDRSGIHPVNSNCSLETKIRFKSTGKNGKQQSSYMLLVFFSPLNRQQLLTLKLTTGFSKRSYKCLPITILPKEIEIKENWRLLLVLRSSENVDDIRTWYECMNPCVYIYIYICVCVTAGPALKPMQPIQLHWVPRFWTPAPWCLGRVDCLFLPDTPCARIQ